MTLATIVLAINVGVGELREAEAQIETLPGNERAESPIEWLRKIGEDVGALDELRHPDAPPIYEEGVTAVTSPILFLIDLFRYVISGIAFIIVVVAAIKLIAYSSEEEAKKAKTTLLAGIAGLLVIQVADPVVKRMFFGELGEAFEDPATAELYAQETVSFIRGIIGFLHIFLGAVAVLVIVLRGFVLITSGGDEEQITKAKKHVLYAVLGLAVVGLSEVVVRGVIFPEAGEALPDVAMGRTILVSITNYISGFVAIASFVVLFYAGYYYVVSGGQEEANEKVKKIVMGAVIGLILALAAFAIVNTVLGVGEAAAANL